MEDTNKSRILLSEIMQAECKSSMWINFFLKESIVNLWFFVPLKKTSWAVENILWSSSDQDNIKDHQCLFHNTYRFLKHNTYRFYIKKSKILILSPHWCWPGYVDHGWCIMSIPQPLFSSYQLLYSFGEVKVISPHMRPLT